MTRPARVLLQTTIPHIEDDWHIGRFSVLQSHLSSLRDRDGEPLFEVVARDRDPPGRPDSVLSKLDTLNFDELWLFAVDTGDGLTTEDCKGISKFRRRGAGILVTRDHMDLGTIAGIGLAHYFHSKNLDPDESRHRRDDPYTTNISWPNYHSGRNGDYQEITPVLPLHPVLRDPTLAGLVDFASFIVLSSVSVKAKVNSPIVRGISDELPGIDVIDRDRGGRPNRALRCDRE